MGFDSSTKIFSNIEDLRLKAGWADGAKAIILNFGTDNEVIGAEWDEDNIEADNGTTIIQVINKENGRWIVKQSYLGGILQALAKSNASAYWTKVKNNEKVTIIARGQSASYGLDTSVTGTLPAINGAPSGRTRNPHNFVDDMQATFDECLLNAEVLNESYPYDRSIDGLVRFSNNTPADAIILEYAANDAMNYEERDGGPVSLEDFRNTLSVMAIEQIILKRWVIFDKSPVEEYTGNDGSGLQSNNYIVRQYHAIVDEVAEKFGCTVIDTDFLTNFIPNRFIADPIRQNKRINLHPNVAAWRAQAVAGLFMNAKPLEGFAGKRFHYQEMAPAIRFIYAGSIPTASVNDKAAQLFPNQACSLVLDIKDRCELVIRGMINDTPNRNIDVVVGRGVYIPPVTCTVASSGSFTPRYTRTNVILEPGLNTIILRNNQANYFLLDEIWLRPPRDNTIEAPKKIIVTDADTILGFEDRYIELPSITANRTLTFWSGEAFDGEEITIVNKNNSAFTWTTSRMEDAFGNSYTSLPNGTITRLKSQGTSNWLVLFQGAINIGQQLLLDGDGDLSITSGNTVSLNVIKDRTINGNDPVEGTYSGILFPFNFNTSSTGWPIASGGGIQYERRSTDTSRSGFRIFNNVTGTGGLYYQEKQGGDLTTWSAVQQIAPLSQVFTQAYINDNFFGIKSNTSTDIGGFQPVDLDAAPGARVFQVDVNVNGLPPTVSTKNNAAIINMYRNATKSPQMLFALDGENYDNSFWYRNRQGNTWYQVADRGWIATNYYTQTQSNARFLGVGFNDQVNLGAYQTVSDLNTTTAARIYRIDSTALNMPVPLAGFNPSVVIDLYGPDGDTPQLIIAISGTNYDNNFWYRSKQGNTWYQVADRAWANSQFATISDYYTKTNLQTSGQASVHWDNITNTPAISNAWGDLTGVPQIIQDIEDGYAGVVTRLSISRNIVQHFAGDANTILTTGIGHINQSGSSNLPVSGENGNMYAGYHADSVFGGGSHLWVSTSSSDNFWFRRRSAAGNWGAWLQVASRDWVTTNFSGAATVQAEITGTVIDPTQGTFRYKSITANTTFTTANFSDKVVMEISISNTDSADHTVAITGVPFPVGSDNVIPAGGSAHISMVQINGKIDAAITIYE